MLTRANPSAVASASSPWPERKTTPGRWTRHWALVVVESGPLDSLRTAELEHLRGQIALMQRRGSDAVRLLLSVARRLEPLDTNLAR